MDLKEDEKIAVEEKKAKLYIPSPIKTQKKSCTFLFLGRLGRPAVLKIFAILLNYPTFEFVCFSYFQRAKQIQN